MTITELMKLKVGNIVRMGRYHWKMEGYNSLKEPVFHRVDDVTIKLLDTVFIPHLMTLAAEGYEYTPKPEKVDEPVVVKEVVKEKASVVEEDIDEIQIEAPKKKRGRPRKPK